MGGAFTFVAERERARTGTQREATQRPVEKTLHGRQSVVVDGKFAGTARRATGATGGAPIVAGSTNGKAAANAPVASPTMGYSFGALPLQAKLTVSDPADELEKEADQVADRVMRMAAPPRSGQNDAEPHRTCEAGTVQRKCAQCEEEERIHRKTEGMGTPTLGDGPPIVSEVLRSAGKPLDAATRAFMEPRFGRDFSAVRVHADTAAAHSARALQARAYTVGNRVVFGADEYAPATVDGRRLLAHELAHTVQQARRPSNLRTLPQRDIDASENTWAPPAPPPIRYEAAAKAPEPTPGSESLVRPMRSARPSVIYRERTAPSERPKPTSPAAASMTVTVHGLHFVPVEGATFAVGPKLPQGLAIMLNRLTSDYRPELENRLVAWLRTHGGVTPTGALIGNALHGEPIPPLVMTLDVALCTIAWLTQRGLAVAVTDAQRDTLRFGAALDDAWADLRTREIAAEVGVTLPSWYTAALFREQMSRRLAGLRGYIDALARFRFEASAENRHDVILALRSMVSSLMPGASTLEAIRLDEQLRSHPVYQALFPPSRSRPMASPRQLPVDRVSFFLSFADTQPELLRRSTTEHSARQELLDRYARFLQRGATTTAETDQQLSDSPGRANAPPLDARLTAYPALSPPLFAAALNADYTFDCEIEFPNVFEAFASYVFRWDYVEVPTDQTESVDVASLPGQTQDWSSVAGARWDRAARYAEADIARIIADLGPAGESLGLVQANNILRYVGTGISLGLEILSTPASEKHLTFSREAVFVVRVKALPVVSNDAALIRAPSVAYLPVFARPGGALASAALQGQVSDRDAAFRRVAELQALLAAPVSHANENALAEELRQLTDALGSAADIVRGQLRVLEARKRDLGPDSPERASIQEQIDRLEQIATVRERRGRSHDLSRAERVYGTFLSDEGSTVNLLMEAVRVSDHAYWVSDLTTPDSSQEQGTGNRVDAILGAVQLILAGIHGYGRGHAAILIDGIEHDIRIDASTGSILTEAIENTATVASIAAVAAAPFTGGVSLAYMLPIGAVAAGPAAYRIISRAIDDTYRMDFGMAMDVVNVVGGVIGLAQATTPIRMVRLGRGLMLLGIGANVGGVLLMGGQVVEQINGLSRLPPGLRTARLLQVMGNAMLNVGIMAGAALAERGFAREREVAIRGESVEATGARSQETGLELRRGGETAQQVADHGTLRSEAVAGGHELKLTSEGCIICSFPCQWFDERYRGEWDRNPAWHADWNAIEAELERAVAANDAAAEATAWAEAQRFQSRLEAEHAQYHTSLNAARASFPALGRALTRLEALIRGRSSTAGELGVINDVARLQTDGKVSGFEQWASGVTGTAESILAEAREARRLVAESSSEPGAVVEFVPRTSRQTPDLHVVVRGVVSRRVEVFDGTNRRSPYAALAGGVAHALEKRGDPAAPGTREATTSVRWPPERFLGRVWDPDGVYYSEDINAPGRLRATGDFVDDVLTQFIRDFSNPDIHLLDRINLIDQEGRLVFSFVNHPPGSHWALGFRRPYR